MPVQRASRHTIQIERPIENGPEIPPPLIGRLFRRPQNIDHLLPDPGYELGRIPARDIACLGEPAKRNINGAGEKRRAA